MYVINDTHEYTVFIFVVYLNPSLGFNLMHFLDYFIHSNTFEMGLVVCQFLDCNVI